MTFEVFGNLEGLLGSSAFVQRHLLSADADTIRRAHAVQPVTAVQSEHSS